MANRTTRRTFVKSAAAAGVGFWAAGGVTPRESRSAIEEINFASIGVGGKGSSDSRDAARAGNMVAICDIDENNLDKAAKRYTGAKKYFDWRKMLDEMGKTIDAVTVSTPDHSHACASATAMRMGKACFTQKPLTHSMDEARTLGKIAKEKGVATQMGNQGTANTGVRQAAKMVQKGHLGEVKEVHVWTNRPVWPQGAGRPSGTQEVPAHVHWDLFLGPAKHRPYNEAYHPFKWRGWWDFGTGALGDMACHTLNMPYMALDLFDPTSVEAVTSGHNKETFPSWSIITFEFPANDNRGPVTLKWYDGGKLPEQSKLGDNKASKSGCVLVGDQDSLYSPNDYGAQFVLLSGSKAPSAEDLDVEKSPGHFTEWVNAIKGGPQARSNFAGYAAGLTETILLGNLAVWAGGEKVLWDSKNMKATCKADVEHLIKHEYPKGYSL